MNATPRTSCQEACLRAFASLDSFEGETARAWLLAIVRNTFYTWLKEEPGRRGGVPFDDRRRGRRQRAGAAGRIDRADPAAARRPRVINAALDTLPQEFREVIVLRELEDLSTRKSPQAAISDRHRDVAPGARARAAARCAGAGRAAGAARGAAADGKRESRMMTRPDNEAERLSAFVDGELDLQSHLAIERAAAADESLRQRIDELQRMRQSIRAGATYHAAPSELQARLARLAPTRPVEPPASAAAASPTRAPIGRAAVDAVSRWLTMASARGLLRVGGAGARDGERRVAARAGRRAACGRRGRRATCARASGSTWSTSPLRITTR